MPTRRAYLAVVLAVWPIALHGQSSPRETLSALMRADNRGDLDAVIALYTDDAVLLPPNEPVVSGKAAIRARYMRLFATTRMDVRFEPIDVYVSGNLAYLRGRTVGRRISADGAKEEDLGNKFLMILERRNSAWLVARLMWSPDR